MDKIFGSFAIIWVVICILGFTGWAMNIYKTFGCDFEAPYKCEAIRIVGIVIPPVGAIAGWIDLEE